MNNLGIRNPGCLLGLVAYPSPWRHSGAGRMVSGLGRWSLYCAEHERALLVIPPREVACGKLLHLCESQVFLCIMRFVLLAPPIWLGCWEDEMRERV